MSSNATAGRQTERPRRRRGPGQRAGLSYPAVVDAALRLVDEHGIDALTMRALAERLDVQPMALYVYVRNKDQLLDALMAALDQEIREHRLRGEWRRRLARHAEVFRVVLRRHPGVAQLYAVRATRGPAWVGSVERVLEAFHDGGFDGAAAVHAYRILTAYVTGYVLGEIRQLGVPPLAERLAGVSATDFPHTWGLARSRARRGNAEFALGVGVVLGGLEQLRQRPDARRGESAPQPG